MAELFSFGPFRLDSAARRLSRDGDEIQLPSRAFDTLAYLVRERHRLVEKDELIKVVWAGAFVSDDSLVHCISVLRRALGDDTEHPQFIATLPRRGYRFVGEVAEQAPIDRTTHVATHVATHEPAPAGRVSPRWRWLAIGAAVLVTVAIAVAASSWMNSGADPSVGPVLLAQLPPPGTSLASGGLLSPDRHHLAFIARDRSTGLSRLWVRSLDSPAAHVISGTDGASKPFWSPDSGSIGFFAGNKLKAVELESESSRTLGALNVSPAGGAWGPRGQILFGDLAVGLRVISEDTGEGRAVTTLDMAQDAAHEWPSFLPDGRHFLYTVTSWNADRAGIWLGSLDSREAPRRLIAATSASVYAAPGFLLYVDGDNLMAVPFDSGRLAVDGDAVVISHSISPPSLTDGDMFSISGALLSFRHRTRTERLAWFSRDGMPIDTVAGPTTFYNPIVSPDGSQVVATGSPSRDPGLWVLDVRRKTSTRLANEGIGPLWSPDGRQIAFTAKGGLEIHVRSAAGPADDRIVLRDSGRKVLQDWSPDGRYLLYSLISTRGDLDVWLLPLAESSPRPVPLLTTSANERHARVSPDGRWLAYTSDESGAAEIYVEEFPRLGSKRAVTVGGGVAPSWRGDGRELFYLASDGTLRSVAVVLGGTISIGPEAILFKPPLAGDILEARNQYTASASGQTFLFNVAEQNTEPDAITVIVNWRASAGMGHDRVIDRTRRIF